ncbi:hypothetical protein GF319_01275 [Candidatus Bathyarchaeota archaeon]|nr:hypothetical protein [Candidatus Bathyarchaeota archaeon]
MSWLLLVLRLILYFLLLIITLILLILVFPLTLSGKAELDGIHYRGEFNFGILLGFLNGIIYFSEDESYFRMRVASISVFKSPLESEEVEEKTEEKTDKKKRSGDFGSFRRLIDPGLKLLRSMLRRIRFTRFNLRIRAGISDPYTSGMIFGVIFPLVEIIKVRFPDASINLTPVFIENTFFGFLDTKLSIRLILLVYPLIRFFTSKEFRAYRRSRR